jgi:hypothetical protein
MGYFVGAKRPKWDIIVSPLASRAMREATLKRYTAEPLAKSLVYASHDGYFKQILPYPTN